MFIFTAIWSWLTSTFGSFLIYLILGVVLAGAAYGVYYSISSQAAQIQLYKDQATQAQAALITAQNLIVQQNGIIKANNDAIQSLNDNITKDQAQFDAIRKSLSDPKLKTTVGSSAILKSVIQQLGGQ